jgi:hypothetical protein
MCGLGHSSALLPGCAQCMACSGPAVAGVLVVCAVSQSTEDCAIKAAGISCPALTRALNAGTPCSARGMAPCAESDSRSTGWPLCLPVPTAERCLGACGLWRAVAQVLAHAGTALGGAAWAPCWRAVVLGTPRGGGRRPPCLAGGAARRLPGVRALDRCCRQQAGAGPVTSSAQWGLPLAQGGCSPVLRVLQAGGCTRGWPGCADGTQNAPVAICQSPGAPGVPCPPCYLAVQQSL